MIGFSTEPMSFFAKGLNCMGISIEANPGLYDRNIYHRYRSIELCNHSHGRRLPRVYAESDYAVRVGDPDGGRFKILGGLTPQIPQEDRVLEVSF